MPIINSIAAHHDEMTEWRRDIHAHPETAFEEERTAAIVAEKLAAWGIEVHRGIATTGVVGVLRGTGAGGRSIGLRADMDALAMDEENDHLPYKSRHAGKFHGCGHDGHTTMLLGAARYLAETRNFDGTVHFIFQPGEEGAGGGLKMVEEGLFERFPCDEVYGLHNWPELPAGTIGLRPGPLMAAGDLLEIEIEGVGSHAAMPHHGVDPVVVAAHVLLGIQSLVSRSIDPLESAVVSLTQINAGSAHNVVPRFARLRGTVRTFSPAIQDRVEAGIKRIAEHTAAAHGAKATVHYNRYYPATVNHPDQTVFAGDVAAEIVGADKVNRNVIPCMGAEDFSFMLNARPGAYVWVGQGGGPSSCNVHNPRYDFNDEILPIGASLLARLAEARLAKTG